MSTAKYKVFNDSSLQTLLNQTKANKSIAAQNKAAIDGLEDDFQGMTTQVNEVLVEVENCLDALDETKADVTAVEQALANKAEKSAIPTKTSQLTNDSGFKTTDNNTTYSLSKSGNTITLTGSDGSTTSVTDADTNTTYSAAGSSLGLVKSGGDVTISSGVITVNDDSHAHVISNVDGLQTALDGKETAGAANTALASAKSYTDTQIAGLINGAPTTLDTLGEIAEAMADNADVVEALETAIGNKADKSAIPTKTSQLTNDSGFKTTDNNTTYTLTKSGSTITLTGSDGSTTSVTDSNTTYSLSSFGVTATADELNKLDGVTATATELNYVDGVTSNIQTQLNGKSASGHNHDSVYSKLGHSHDYLPLAGGTMSGTITMDNTSTTVQKNEPYIQWATIGSNKPYTGFAHDQTDGTFIICSMEKDTTTNGVKYYKNGLAIGGGSGNLFWKGDRVITNNDLTALLNRISALETALAGKQDKIESWSDLKG